MGIDIQIIKTQILKLKKKKKINADSYWAVIISSKNQYEGKIKERKA